MLGKAEPGVEPEINNSILTVSVSVSFRGETQLDRFVATNVRWLKLTVSIIYIFYYFLTRSLVDFFLTQS